MSSAGETYRVVPRGPIDAVVEVPGSKSIANRALICAALAEGESVLTRMPDGDDTEAMIECLSALGVHTERRGDTVSVGGGRARLLAGPRLLSARLAGTTARFVTALAALGRGPYTIDGEPALRRRPMAPLHDALAALGAVVETGGEPGHLPVTVRGPLAVGDETPQIALPGDVSSQYLTALMLIAPCLAHGLRLVLTTPLVSRPYVQMTAAVMAAFGVPGVEVGARQVTVPAGRYEPCAYEIEPDASSASYPLAAAAICGGKVRVPGLVGESLQGDAAFVDVLAEMGCQVARDESGTSVARPSTTVLRGIDIDMVDMSDLVPTIAAVAAFAAEPVRVRGVGFIRAKESDRLGALCRELRRAGIDAVDDGDGLTVRPSRPHGAVLATHHDHRLAMSFALVGLGLTDENAGPVEVTDPGVVAKSWPGFWAMLEKL
jgi:3-phosphoshikimate 1-carboxyvinyltransferase